MPQFSHKKGLTLVEMIVVLTIFFLLLVVIVQIYRQMITIKYTTEAKQTLIQESYYMLEKINVEFKNYNIDYEEYFNRSSIGCDSINHGENFIRDVNTNNNGYCDNFSSYGNKNTVSTHFGQSEPDKHQLYNCSSTNPETYTPKPLLSNPLTSQGSGCYTSLLGTGWQSYGEYSLQFRDRKDDVDSLLGAVDDSDDTDIGKGPVAIFDSNNVQELYLISQDKNRRMFLRRALISSGDRNGDGIIGSGFEHEYTLQLLRLKSFDAGENHNFNNTTGGGVYDSQIDTRTCDYAEGFICNGPEIKPLLYPGYKLPSSSNDGRVNIFPKNLTITDRNISIYPTKDPELARFEDKIQINPYFILSFTNQLYGEVRQGKIPAESMDNFSLTLQTTFNTRGFYGQ